MKMELKTNVTVNGVQNGCHITLIKEGVYVETEGKFVTEKGYAQIIKPLYDQACVFKRAFMQACTEDGVFAKICLNRDDNIVICETVNPVTGKTTHSTLTTVDTLKKWETGE